MGVSRGSRRQGTSRQALLRLRRTASTKQLRAPLRDGACDRFAQSSRGEPGREGAAYLVGPAARDVEAVDQPRVARGRSHRVTLARARIVFSVESFSSSSQGVMALRSWDSEALSSRRCAHGRVCDSCMRLRASARGSVSRAWPLAEGGRFSGPRVADFLRRRRHGTCRNVSPAEARLGAADCMQRHAAYRAFLQALLPHACSAHQLCIISCGVRGVATPRARSARRLGLSCEDDGAEGDGTGALSVLSLVSAEALCVRPGLDWSGTPGRNARPARLCSEIALSMFRN